MLYAGVTLFGSEWQYITNTAVQVQQNAFRSDLERANYFVPRTFSRWQQTAWGEAATRPVALTAFIAAFPYPITGQLFAQL
jgi:hypothetical protein